MDFASEEFLRSHIKSILDFYEPNVIDPSGGFFQNFKDDGTVFAAGNRHLVSSCRMVFNYCKACELFGDDQYRDYAVHGHSYIRDYHWDDSRQGFHWTLKDGHLPADEMNHCYGLAFVMLAATAVNAIGESQEDIDRVWNILESRLWDDAIGLYADEATPDWSVVDAYRGQNANMHICEALIAAFEATQNERYLDRAYDIAKLVTVDLAAKSDGLVWEHFTSNLSVDWDYNKDDPKNLYRPWGFQPGHQVEWAKLLLTLEGHRAEVWMTSRAIDLFDRALDTCWDNEHGGIFYGFAPNGDICDSDKYFWVQAEAIAASARLAKHTGDARYREWYDRIWQYAWDHMIDHEHGAWYRVLTADNQKLSDEKSIAGGKCDYHTIGACYDVLKAGAA